MEFKSKSKINSGFTLITQQKANVAKTCENTDLCVNAHTVTAHMHKPTENTTVHAIQGGAAEGEVDLNKKGGTRTAVTPSDGDGNTVTSSDQQQAGGTEINLFCRRMYFIHNFFFFTKDLCLKITI